MRCRVQRALCLANAGVVAHFKHSSVDGRCQRGKTGSQGACRSDLLGRDCDQAWSLEKVRFEIPAGAGAEVGPLPPNARAPTAAANHRPVGTLFGRVPQLLPRILPRFSTRQASSPPPPPPSARLFFHTTTHNHRKDTVPSEITPMRPLDSFRRRLWRRWSCW